MNVFATKSSEFSNAEQEGARRRKVYHQQMASIPCKSCSGSRYRTVHLHRIRIVCGITREADS